MHAQSGLYGPRSTLPDTGSESVPPNNPCESRRSTRDWIRDSMAGIFATVGFPFLSGDDMPTTICSGPVYTWKEGFIQGAGWKKHRLTLYEDGTLIWDEPQSNRTKGCVQLSQVFRRVGIGTLYNSVDQQKAAAKSGLTIQEHGLLLPFSRGDGGLELSQFAVTSVAELRKWMEAFARQMNVSHILNMVAEGKSTMKSQVAAMGKRQSIFSEKFWLEESRMARERAASIVPPDQLGPDGLPISHLAGFKASECADIWREFQETYHVCTSASARQYSQPSSGYEEEEPNGLHRSMSTKSLPAARVMGTRYDM